jgi:putative ABC transport system permease protein
MGVPLSYNIRNLVERKSTTLMTAAGIALTVAVLVIVMALRAGLTATFAATGHPLQAIVLRKGVSAELNSVVLVDAYQLVKLMPGIAKTAAGLPMASPEMISIVNLPSVDNPAGMNVTVRGLTGVGVGMRSLRIAQGRWFRPGLREIVVGESVARRYKAASIGSRVRFGRGWWRVVGVFTGGQSAVNSEIWVDLNQLCADFDRQGEVSSVLVRATGPAELDELIRAVKDNRQLNATALKEQDYYAGMTSSGAPLQVLGMFIATIMAIGSGFGAMNTMYAAVARRGREIGTLRSLGFSRASILRSFMFESVALALVGGVLGCMIALPLNGVTTGVGNFETFSEVAFNFRVGPDAIMVGLLFAAVVGALGGFLPARAAARRDLLTALREA